MARLPTGHEVRDDAVSGGDRSSQVSVTSRIMPTITNVL